MKKLFSLLASALMLFTCSMFLSACGDKNNCAHNFNSEWFLDDTHHWQQCGICGEKGAIQEHSFVQENVTEEYLKAPASTTSKSVYYKSCVCGAKGTETFEDGKLVMEITNVKMSSTNIVYGDNYSVEYTTLGNATIEYKYENEPEEMYTTTKPTNAGNYSCRVSVAETDTHYACSKEINFEIKKKKLENLQTTVVYNGQQLHEIDLSQIEEGLSLSVVFDSANVGATAQEVFVYKNNEDTFNYEVVTSGDNACQIEIVKKELELSWIAPWTLSFKNEGYDFEPSVEFNNLEINDECFGIIELNSGDNYWYDSTFTYKITGIDGLHANNYKLPTENLVSPEYTITCDGETALNQQINLKNMEAYDGEVDTKKDCILKINIENAGEYKFKYNLQSEGAEYSIFIMKKGVKGDAGSIRSVSFTTGHPATGNYSDTFVIAEPGEYYLKITKYTTETTEGIDLVELCYSYQS